MPKELPLRCACGSVRGAVLDVSPQHGNHLVCYCDDCQAFARLLDAADRTLDAHGGTDLFQTSAGRVVFREGLERLACLRLTARGPLRWYASCCRTPVGNTMASRQVPFLGLIGAAIDPALDAAARDALLGPVRARVFTRHAIPGDGAPEPDVRIPISTILRVVRIALGGRLRGDHRRTPFFDATTGAPIAPPRQPDDDALRAARETHVKTM